MLTWLSLWSFHPKVWKFPLERFSWFQTLKVPIRKTQRIMGDPDQELINKFTYNKNFSKGHYIHWKLHELDIGYDTFNHWYCQWGTNKEWAFQNDELYHPWYPNLFTLLIKSKFLAMPCVRSINLSSRCLLTKSWRCFCQDPILFLRLYPWDIWCHDDYCRNTFRLN